jgi:predicted DNA-binding transcriptional regulator AlpA
MPKLKRVTPTLKVRTVLRLPAVLAATGWAKATLYAKIEKGKFPKGTRLDPDARTTVWFEDEVVSWQHGGWEPPKPA